jgi:hypothetical protein
LLLRFDISNRQGRKFMRSLCFAIIGSLAAFCALPGAASAAIAHQPDVIELTRAAQVEDATPLVSMPARTDHAALLLHSTFMAKTDGPALAVLDIEGRAAVNFRQYGSDLNGRRHASLVYGGRLPELSRDGGLLYRQRAQMHAFHGDSCLGDVHQRSRWLV